MGGNSTKATSGINGALTQAQLDDDVKDSVKQFYEDTLKSARDKARPDLIKGPLHINRPAAVEWLQEVFWPRSYSTGQIRVSATRTPR